jgi:hypothetical protein
MNGALKKGGLLLFETGNIADVNPKYMKWFSQFSYPDHLFFFGEHSLQLLLDATGFTLVSVHRERILLQLVLQKVLWKFKDSLKEEQVLYSSERATGGSNSGSRLTLKRRLRLLYRYAGFCLLRCGCLLPTRGRPLKLLVLAKKTGAPQS